MIVLNLVTNFTGFVPLGTVLVALLGVAPIQAQLDADTDFALNSPFPEPSIASGGVFAGDGERPYRVEDQPAPVSVYGESKLAGEKAVLCGGAIDAVGEALPDAGEASAT